MKPDRGAFSRAGWTGGSGSISTQTANRFGQFALELNQLKLLADAKASELERSLSDFAKHLSDGFQEYSTQTANRFGQFALELNQLKLLADAKVNRLEQSDATHRLSRQLDHQLARSADHLAQLEVELRQLKLLADAKANEIELTGLQREVGELKQGKADRSGLETLRVSLRDALEGKADTREISVLQLHLKQAVADVQGQLADTQTVLAGKAEQQALADVQGQLRFLDESKSDKSELTRLTNHFVDLVQTKAHADDIVAVREQIQRLASVDSLVEIRQYLQEGLSTKADQTILITLQQSIETRASVEVMDTTIHRLASLEQAKAASDHLSQELVDIRRQILDHKRNIVDQQRRLALLLEEARKRLPEPLNQAQLVVMGNEADHLLDTMYVAFEDCFRGTREDIKQRLSAYLPALPQGVGSGFAPAVDLGCGRGEWLELLKERGLAATGVDLNRVMAEFCRERELEVVEADALAYLCDQPDSSLGLITGFHIIEHVPLRTLIALLDESLRVLQPGGMVIFETPNPENLVVGACNFYMDPTHRNPLPPTMTQFLVEARGFVRCEIRRMNQQVLNDPLRLLEPGIPGVAELNPLIQMAKDHYFAAPDYAVIGYKA
jgi:SAM-dependent methyltransferase